jgi:hypothetical protein
LAGKTEVLGENTPKRHFVHHKFHLTRPGIETCRTVRVREPERKTTGYSKLSGNTDEGKLRDLKFHRSIYESMNFYTELNKIHKYFRPRIAFCMDKMVKL